MIKRRHAKGDRQMIDKVEAKIAELKKQQREEYYRKKEADLAQWGLGPQKKGKKSAPLVVTDEEYEALIDASSGVGMPTRNGFARVLNIAALIVAVAGIIIGFVVANLHEEMSFPIFMGAVVAAVLVALIFLGIGEALRLLQQIADMQRIEYARRRPQMVKEFPDEQPEVQTAFSVENAEDLPSHPYRTVFARPQDETQPADSQEALPKKTAEEVDLWEPEAEAEPEAEPAPEAQEATAAADAPAAD